MCARVCENCLTVRILSVAGRATQEQARGFANTAECYAKSVDVGRGGSYTGGMGHTHYWYYNRPFTRGEWDEIGRGFARLVETLADVPLVGPRGTGMPIFMGHYLGFNGTAPQAVEPFELFRTREAWERHTGAVPGRKWRGSCKTEGLPYDRVVMAVLLLALATAPDALRVESDGEMDGEEWKKASEILKIK